ncbi:MAG TPA: hypothetical protein DDY16_07190, partial [Tenacibaculum sp.]|nr:hypothetical protein [Tenacibaculum sp.]
MFISDLVLCGFGLHPQKYIYVCAFVDYILTKLNQTQMPKTKKLHLAQQEIYLGQMIDPQSSLYNIGGYTVLKGQLNVELFKNILEELPSFFDVFSMRFSSSSKGPSYHLEDKIQKIPVEEVDLSHYEDPVASAKKWIQREFDVPFNIETDRLCRFTLFKISEEEYWWQILFHHLIIDGFGFAVLINHVTDRYDQLIQGTVKELNYPSYVETINKNIAYLSSKQFLADKEYWESKYKEVPKALVTPKNISKEEFPGGERFSYSISASERSLFERLTKSTGASLPQLTIAALLLYFGKTTAEKDISIGTPIHNRGGRAERNTLGMFVSVLAYKGSYDPEQSVLECLAEIKKTQRNDIRHRNYPISFLNRSLSMLSESRQHIFDVIVNYEPLGFREKLASGIDVEQKHMTSTKHLQYPLSIRWCDYGAEVPMELKVDYMTRYLSKEDIVFFVDRLFFILRQFEESLANPLNDILIVPKSEQQLLLKDFQS